MMIDLIIRKRSKEEAKGGLRTRRAYSDYCRTKVGNLPLVL